MPSVVRIKCRGGREVTPIAYVRLATEMTSAGSASRSMRLLYPINLDPPFRGPAKHPP